jgi:hypothetical protein
MTASVPGVSTAFDSRYGWVVDNPMPFFDNPCESVVERRIREAMDRGEFDDLPGIGEPFRDAGQPYHELWWVKSWLKRNEPNGESSPLRGG